MSESTGKIRMAVCDAVAYARDNGVSEADVRADVDAALSLFPEPKPEPAYAVSHYDDFSDEGGDLGEFPTATAAEEAANRSWADFREVAAENTTAPYLTWKGTEGTGWYLVNYGPRSAVHRVNATYSVRRVR